MRCVRALVASLAVLAGLGGPAVAAPGTASIWLPYWDMPAALPTVVSNADLFETASPFWYDAAGCRTVTGKPGAGDDDVIASLRGKGLVVVPTVTASGLVPRQAVRCLGNATRRTRHVRALVRLVQREGYDGIDLDYENLALTSDLAQGARVRRAFSAFAAQLCGRLDSLGKRCVVTVMAATNDATTVIHGQALPSVYDYAALCAAASRLRVMAYDLHNRYTRAGPIAGLPWVNKVVAYATAKCDPAQVELGVPLYGRDWGSRSFATLTGDEAFALARRHGVRPRFDPIQREYTFTYRSAGERHRVWASGPRSAAVRSRLARAAGLAGATYWAAGQQPAGTFAAVRRHG